jgi:hypothetical protein
MHVIHYYFLCLYVQKLCCMARSRASSKVRCLDVGTLLPALPPPHPVPAPPPPPPQPVPAPAPCFCFCGVIVAETMTLKGRLMHALRYLGGCFTTTDCSSPKLSCCTMHQDNHNHSVVLTQYHYHYNQPPPLEGPRVSHGGSIASEASQVNRSSSRGSEASQVNRSGSRARSSSVSTVVVEVGSRRGDVAEAGSSIGSNLC